MRATRINHVSIPADSLDESARFYEQLFGMERIPTPNFGGPVVWLRLGEQQLHLYESADEPPSARRHVSFDVDDLDAVYARAKELGILDIRAFGAALRSHP